MASIIIQFLVGFPRIPKHVTFNDPEWLFHVKFYFAPVGLERLSMTFENKRVKINTDRPIQSEANYSLGTLVSGNIGLMRMFAGVFWKGGVKRQWGRALTLMHASWRIRCVRNKSAGSSDVGFRGKGRRFIK